MGDTSRFRAAVREAYAQAQADGVSDLAIVRDLLCVAQLLYEDAAPGGNADRAEWLGACSAAFDLVERSRRS